MSFFDKLKEDLAKKQSWPFALIGLLLLFLEPINKLIKIFKELPPEASATGIYLAFLMAFLYIRKSRERGTGTSQKETPRRYSRVERRVALISFVCITLGYLTFIGYRGLTAYNSRQEEKARIRIQKDKEEEERKKNELLNKKLNILVAQFSEQTDHFSRQLAATLSQKLNALQLDVVNKYVQTYFYDVTGVNERIQHYIDSIGIKQALFAYGDYDPYHESLICRIYIHNLNNCITLQLPELSNTDCIKSLPDSLEVDFGKKLNFVADFIIGLLQYKVGNYLQSNATLNQLAAEDSLPPAVQRLVFKMAGDNGIALKDYSGAIAFYNAAQEREPNNDTLKYYRAIAYKANNEPETAREILKATPTNFRGKERLNQSIEIQLANPNAVKKGVSQNNSGSFDLNTDNAKLKNLAFVSELSVGNKRLFAAGSSRDSFQVYDETGRMVYTVNGKNADSLVRKNLASRNKKIFTHEFILEVRQ